MLLRAGQLACLYGYACNKSQILRIDQKLLDFWLNPVNFSEIIGILEKLEPYRKDNGYISEIARLKSQDQVFSIDNVRAYWLGSRDQRIVDLNHNSTVLKRVKNLSQDQHLTDPVVNLMFNCSISFGRVIRSGRDQAWVETQGLVCQGKKIFFEPSINKSIDLRFIRDGLKRGDLLSIHFDIAREKISQEQAEILKEVSLRAIEGTQTLK